MPLTIAEHIQYTNDELNSLPYYKEMFSILENKPIKYYLDIGANVGEFRNVVITKIPSIEKSFLIEPENSNFEFLQNHVKDKEKCVFYNVGIGYGADTGKLLRSDNIGGHQIKKNCNGEIIIKQLEDLELPIVDLVKMDVEGMEYEIIINSSYLKKVKWLDIEFHQTPEQVKNNYVKNFIAEHLPDFDIIVYQNDGLNTYGRCLLKNYL